MHGQITVTIVQYCTWPAGGGGTMKLVMALVGKFAVSGSFALTYLFSAELFPTQVRYGVAVWKLYL